uniref:Reverse transcriptase zinc-binding domain-containing protein n=1 Tax=Cannabis sativa TaxID=3483 RepID=A0A803Q6X3_CANSA
MLRLVVTGRNLRAKTFYNLLLEGPKAEYVRAIWDNLLLPKHRFFYWQIVNSQLITRDFLCKLVPLKNTMCPVCEIEFETHDHALFSCIFAKQVLEDVNSWLGVYNWPILIADLISRCRFKEKDLTNRVLNMVIAATLYQLWKYRNRCILS